MDNRRFHRVPFVAPGTLNHQGMEYRVRLENISLRGALISSNDCIMIPKGDSCTLCFDLAGEASQLCVTAQVVHAFFSMVGVEFIGINDETGQLLFGLMQQISGDPEKLRQEWLEIQASRVMLRTCSEND
jgi:hypothetical protein